MTISEKAKEMGLEVNMFGVAFGCPCNNGLSTEAEDSIFCIHHECPECYAREYKAPEAAPEETPGRMAKAAAAEEAMRHFSTGAVRDSAVGKGRYDLLPFAAIHALAQHQQRGADHYGERNIDKGLPQSSLMDSALRHIGLYIQGDSEDYHLVAALWNIAWACEQEAKRPEMIDLPERTEKSGKAI